MGPQASAKLLEVLIDMCTKDFGVRNETDFPEIILDSIPAPDFISNKRNVGITLNILATRVKSLEIFNPICFGIACNTAHLLLNDLQSKTKIPFISIIDEVVNQVSCSKIDRIGVLATPVTINSDLYQKALGKQKISVVTPSKADQKIVEKVIRNILAGKTDDVDKQRLVLISETLEKKGAQGIILGCTELPLIFPKRFSLPVFDSIEILSRALLERFFEANKKFIKDGMIAL